MLRHQGFKGTGKGSWGDPVESDDESSVSEPTTSIPDPIKYSPDEIHKRLNGGEYRRPTPDFWPLEEGQTAEDLWTI